MKSFLIFGLIVVAASMVGCGDPAPSTPIAPDVAPPDASKFSQSDIDKFHESENARGSDHKPAGGR